MMAEITAHHGLLKDTNLYVDDVGGPGRPIVLIRLFTVEGVGPVGASLSG
jgi:non-heme chloroperoxidase